MPERAVSPGERRVLFGQMMTLGKSHVAVPAALRKIELTVRLARKLSEGADETDGERDHA